MGLSYGTAIEFILKLMRNEPLTLHGSGLNKRHFLDATDFAEALLLLTKTKNKDRIYNIGTTQEYQNIDIANMLCHAFGLAPQQNIKYVEDRPFNDGRYSINWDKMTALGWKPTKTPDQDLPAIIQWYQDEYGRYGEPTDIINKPIH